MRASFLVTLLSTSLFHTLCAQTEHPLPDISQNETSHCINELESITSPTELLLSNPSGISPNYSVATSISYHSNSSTILIAGDFFYINDTDPSNRTYYSFFQGFTHSKNHTFTKKYANYAPYTNPSFANKYISHKSLRSWTRVIAHPFLPYFYVLGIENLTQYDIANGEFMWTASITPCSAKAQVNTQPLIYNDATFFESDTEHIYVGGSCVNDSGSTVIVLDQYSILNGGAFMPSFRQTYNLTQLGFIKEVHLLDGFGLTPPEITLRAPVNDSCMKHTSVVDKYFYVGFTHLILSGMARIEHDSVANDWRVKKWPEHWTLVNPSFVLHHSIATTCDGLIGLLDPAISGVFGLFAGKMKHLTRWDTKKAFDQLDEHNIYNTFTWYGGHEKRDLHLDWTLSIDALSDYAHAYVTTAPLALPTVKTSTIAKHAVKTGEVIGGAKVPFFALDSIVTRDGQLITVGFEWTPSLQTGFDLSKFNISMILPYLERKAVFQVFNNEIADTSSCIGCEVDYHGNKCLDQCTCLNGYCDDDLEGTGDCYCTVVSYGANCTMCDGLDGSCNPMKGICNSGPEGDGRCKFCYDLEVEIAQNISNSSFHFGLGEHYGPQCADNCTCDTKNGLCFTIGNMSDERAGHCIYCTNSAAWGADCDMECDCDADSEYCSNGVHGTGCTKYDYGGLLNDRGWRFYTVIASALFVVLFSITWWHSNTQFKQENGGKSMPWCPQKERSKNDNGNAFSGDNDEYYEHNANGNGHLNDNDLRESMIKYKNLQNDPNEPPAVSHIVDASVATDNATVEQNKEPQTYHI